MVIIGIKWGIYITLALQIKRHNVIDEKANVNRNEKHDVSPSKSVSLFSRLLGNSHLFVFGLM